MARIARPPASTGSGAPRPTGLPARGRLAPGPLALGALGAGAVTAGAFAAALLWRLAVLAPARPAEALRIDQLVELGVLAAGVAIACWLALGAAVAVGCAVSQAFGRTWSGGERFVARRAPALVRRLLVLAVGAGVGASAAIVPAGAQDVAPPADLGWAVTLPTGPAIDQTAAAPASQPAPAPAPASAPPTAVAPDAVVAPQAVVAPEVVVVRPGDSLWRIAAESLPAGASPAEIAAAWPRWYAANRSTVGPDPGRIHPGQELTAPATDASGELS
ncbi:LysM peptidoglycan-binding domain-containing protein [Pengzhenrongella sicca]|uniref:LysM peptidoglycan-binding domain-containing protein n=1 Tax=Pengzhenrongella sicca TaxID=2819238 RepID=A0A8A4ZL35_9MICO|nr:LysM domain-containing protein [Pengzhenrongella sicca]QTE30288.1 LysM peptidoglycan-binding domain-containing protein [Pengzhenrongella sicca]